MSLPWARTGCGVAIVALLVAATLRWVDLTPRVDRAFFFAESSDTLAQSQRIAALFERHSQLLVIAASPDIGGERYLDRIAALEADLVQLDGVLGSQSLASGPGDLEDAQESPLWRRLLLADDGSATHLLLIVADPWPDTLIPRVESVVGRHEKRDFSLAVAGVPHSVVMMQRQLSRDFTVFSAVAVAGFGLAALLLFGSIRVAIAVIASCTGAVAITFLVLQASGASLGLLSANLVTIVFVLTQSHLVFLTSNWRRTASEKGRDGSVARAMRETLRPSIASMATTLLGFGTLLFVDAKPLRELGLGGIVGGGAAFAVSYLLYPLFLAGARPKQALRVRSAPIVAALSQRRPALAVALTAACALAGVGLVRLETDPSMLTYFDEDGEIHEALSYLDRNTGSAPLDLVLRRADGKDILDAEDAYRELWQVQHALEAESTVGRIVSLPVLLAEGERFPLSFLMTKSMWLRLLESPLFDRVGRIFVSDDREHTLFVLYMAEQPRETTRMEVLERLQAIVARAGFEVPLVGGVFYLQGKLSEVVARSMMQSLITLAVLFAGIAWWTTGSIRVGFCMVLVLALIPVAVFGAMGAVGIPVDIVTAPAASIGLGLAADTLLHLGVAARRSAPRAPGAWSEWDAWTGGIRSQWNGIACAALIAAVGFSLFAFSGFPPTRRFGLAVAASIALAAPLALVVLPMLASRAPRRRGAG